jgi:hypothetical protein
MGTAFFQPLLSSGLSSDNTQFASRRRKHRIKTPLVSTTTVSTNSETWPAFIAFTLLPNVTDEPRRQLARALRQQRS